MIAQKKIIFLQLIILLLSFNTYAQEESKNKLIHDFELELNGEYSYFFENGLYQDQKNHFPSLSIKPKYSVEWNDAYDRITVEGFFRWDRDEQRTHWDIRELYYQKAKNKWEFNVGLKKVFWGVTESNHLVDIINQTDQVESFDGEAKLGQPMVQTTFISDKYGTFDFSYLPYHRKRVFSGREGRLRFPVLFGKDDLGYEGGANEWSPGFAFRWSHYFNIIDIGITQFYGNGREPVFAFNPTGELNAFYPTIYQSGLDFQITQGAFLWKLESIYRYADIQDFFALVVGVEYTFSNINRKGLDIGLIAEYSYDTRDELALNALQNDLFVGSRIAFNDAYDTAILFGGITDLKSGSKIFSLEASRRFGNSWTLELEARIFGNIDKEEFILSNFRDDSFFKASISKYF